MKFKLFLLLGLISIYFISSALIAFSQGLPAPLWLTVVSEKAFYNTADNFQLNITLVNSDTKPVRADIVLQIYQRMGLKEEQSNVPVFKRNWFRYHVMSGRNELRFNKSITSLRLSEGAYPIRVSIWQKGQEVAQARTVLVVVNEHPPEEYLPIGLILVWPLHERAHFNPRGIFVDNKIAEDSNTDINSPGIYYRHLAAVSQYPSIQVTMAITPLLIEQMVEMQKGYRILRNGKLEVKTRETKEVKDITAVFNRYSELFSSGQVALLSAPYAFPSLPLLADSGWNKDLQLQIAKGRKLIMEAFKLGSLNPSLYLPGLSLNSDSIAYLAKERIENTILNSKIFKRIIGNEGGDIYTSYRIQDLDNNRITVIFRDDIASEALGLEDKEEAVQKLLGRLAEVYLYNPTRQKVVAVVAEPGAQPSREKLESLYRTLELTPWIKTVTLEDGIELAPPSSRPYMMLDSPFEEDYLSIEYRKKLGLSHKAYKLFAQMVEEENPIRKKLEKEILIAEAWDWTKSPNLNTVNLGLDFVQHIEDSVESELAKVKILSKGTITLSSLSGKIPIAIFNKASYPFRMILKVKSNNFNFPKGSSRIIKLKPKENIFFFMVVAYHPGVFPLNVSIFSNSKVIDEQTITIKATSFTRTFFFVSLLLMVAILLYFLIRFYVKGVKH